MAARYVRRAESDGAAPCRIKKSRNGADPGGGDLRQGESCAVRSKAHHPNLRKHDERTGGKDMTGMILGLSMELLPWLMALAIANQVALSWMNRHVFHMGHDAFMTVSFLVGLVSGGIAFFCWLIFGRGNF